MASVKEYADIAVRVASNSTLRAVMSAQIKEGVKPLFRQDDMVREWERFLTTAKRQHTDQGGREAVVPPRRHGQGMGTLSHYGQAPTHLRAQLVGLAGVTRLTGTPGSTGQPFACALLHGHSC